MTIETEANGKPRGAGRFIAINVVLGPLIGLLLVVLWWALGQINPFVAQMPYGGPLSLDVPSLPGIALYVLVGTYVLGAIPSLAAAVVAVVFRRWVASTRLFLLLLVILGFLATVAWGELLRAWVFRANPSPPQPDLQGVVVFGLIGAIAALVCGLLAAWWNALPRRA